MMSYRITNSHPGSVHIVISTSRTRLWWQINNKSLTSALYSHAFVILRWFSSFSMYRCFNHVFSLRSSISAAIFCCLSSSFSINATVFFLQNTRFQIWLDNPRQDERKIIIRKIAKKLKIILNLWSWFVSEFIATLRLIWNFPFQQIQFYRSHGNRKSASLNSS